jgi:uncharacterized DUF497 family protein
MLVHSVIHYQESLVAQFVFYQWIFEFLTEARFEFEWDTGNSQKNFLKHGILTTDAEAVFFDEQIIVLGIQVSPETLEDRFGVIGKTKEGSILFISFTVRLGRIRIISSRTANQKEREIYEK